MVENTNGGGKQPPRKSFLYYYGLVMLIVMLLNIFLFPSSISHSFYTFYYFIFRHI